MNIYKSGDLFLEHIRNEVLITLFIELSNNSREKNQNILKNETIIEISKFNDFLIRFLESIKC